MLSKFTSGVTGQRLSVLQIALVVAPAFVLFGYNQAGIGGLLTEDNWVKTFPEIGMYNHELLHIHHEVMHKHNDAAQDVMPVESRQRGQGFE